MIEIIAAPLAGLRKEQHLGLMTALDHLMMQETLVKLGLEVQYPPFSSALAVENAAVQIEQGSLTTGKMDELDAEREDLLTGFTHLVENGLRHFDLTKRNAAEIVKHIIDKYGNFRRKTNADETVDFRAMTHELLSAENLPHLSALSEDGPEWVNRIQTVNEQYGALNEARNAETKGTHVTTSLEAREVMNPYYTAIIKRVNALAVVNGEANYITFINRMNGYITDYKTTMAVQAAARKKQVLPAPPVA